MKEAADKKINLRDLDDISCTIVVCGRQIRKMIKKFPSMDDITIDCWVYSGHYTQFKLKNNKFTWIADPCDKCKPGCEIINEDSDIDKEELHKLIVFTYHSMCDSQNGVDLSDTPEDMLAFAESKLQELLRDEEITDKESFDAAI